MANVMRHRYGAKNPVLAEVASATVIEIGDLICLVSKLAVNAATIASAQVATAANQFLGVAMEASANGETTPIRVATEGTFEFPCDSATLYLGYFAEFDDNETQINDQSVNIATARSNKTIGSAMPNNTAGIGGASKTSCLVRIWSNALYPFIDG
jgi:predicted RecA/RadA family phage recombinase